MHILFKQYKKMTFIVLVTKPLQLHAKVNKGLNPCKNTLGLF